MAHRNDARRYSLILMLGLMLGHIGCGDPAPPPAPAEAPPPPAAAPMAPPTAFEDVRELVVAMGTAAQGDQDCAAVIAALTTVVEAEKARIDRLGATEVKNASELLHAEQALADHLTEVARACKGEDKDGTLLKALQPLSRFSRNASPAQDACDCDSICVTGLRTVAACTYAWAGCFGGDEQMCCETIVCSNTLCEAVCPTLECCDNIDPNGPSGPPPPPE